MKSRHKRMVFIVVGLAALGGAVALIMNALQSNINHFFSPTEVIANRKIVHFVSVDWWLRRVSNAKTMV